MAISWCLQTVWENTEGVQCHCNMYQHSINGSTWFNFFDNFLLIYGGIYTRGNFLLRNVWVSWAIVERCLFLGACSLVRAAWLPLWLLCETEASATVILHQPLQPIFHFNSICKSRQKNTKHIFTADNILCSICPSRLRIFFFFFYQDALLSSYLRWSLFPWKCSKWREMKQQSCRMSTKR